jgi:dienelactone hydrolase
MTAGLRGFRSRRVDLLGSAREVFVRGDGPAVLVLSEVPGITPQVAAFATRVADAGFRVYMPQLFGTPGKPLSIPGALGVIGRVCISREFRVFAAHRSSPIVDWLRALARLAHAECGGPGVGVVGMCLTGNFGLAMMLDAPVLAPVLSQPSLPAGLLPAQRAGLHASPAEIAAAHEKIEQHGARILGLRFTGDPMCPGERFERLRAEFGDAFEPIEIDNRHARRGTGTPPHSVLTTHLIDEQGEPTRAALDRTLAFLAGQLRPGDGAPPVALRAGGAQ